MASTYSTNLALELIGTGDQAGTWGATTNINLGTLLEQAVSGYVTQGVTTGADSTITIPNGATGVARNMYIELTGTGGTNTNLIVPANKKLYFIFNNASGAVTVKVSGQTGVSVPAGKKVVLVSNGTDIVNGLNYIENFGTNSFTVTSITATSGAITTLTATSATVTSLAATSASISDLSATVARSASATVTNLIATTATIADLSATVARAASASITNIAISSATVTNMTVSGTLTGNLTGNITGNAANVSGTVAVANGGTGQTSYTNGQLLIGSTVGNTLNKATLTAGGGISITNGSGAITISTSGGGGDVSGPASSTDNAVARFDGVGGKLIQNSGVTIDDSGNMTVTGTITGNLSGNITGNASNVSGTVAVANGGTGQTSYTNGQLLIGNTSGNTLTKATLTAGTGISITNGGGSITIAATGGGGDVTGPSSAADNAIARFDGTTGKIIQNSGLTIDDSSNLMLGGNVHGNSTGAAYTIGANPNASITSGGFIQLYGSTSSNMVTLGTNGSEHARIDSSGNLLVGLTSQLFPSTNRRTFEVNGTSQVLYGLAVGGTSAGYLLHDGTDMTLSQTRAGALAFHTNNSERARITSSGNFGIGTNNPQQKMDVLGSVRSTSPNAGTVLDHTASDGGTTRIGAYAAAGATLALATAPSGGGVTDRITISSAGVINVSDGSGNSYEVGYRNVPIVTGGVERGKCYSTTASATVNTAASGDVYTVYNNSSASITLIQGSGLTMRLAGTTTTGTRTVAARGLATILFVAASECIVSGAGVS